MVHVVVQSQPARVGESREGGAPMPREVCAVVEQVEGLVAVGVLHVQHLMQYGG